MEKKLDRYSRQILFEGIATNAAKIYQQAAALTPRESLGYAFTPDGGITPQLSRSGDRRVSGAEAVEEHYRLFAEGQKASELEPATA